VHQADFSLHNYIEMHGQQNVKCSTVKCSSIFMSTTPTHPNPLQQQKTDKKIQLSFKLG